MNNTAGQSLAEQPPAAWRYSASRRASSLVSIFAAVRRPGSSLFFRYILSFYAFCENEQTVRVWGFEASTVSQTAMPQRLYFLQQAQVCISLARSTNDPILKERLEDLALNFVQHVSGERDLGTAAPPLAAIKNPKRARGR
jgi:hypothetical protein